MTSAVFLDFKGMNVEQVTKLRDEFRKAGVEYRVVKNTLVKQALKEHAVRRQARRRRSSGMTGIAWSYEDPSRGRQGRQGLPQGRGDADEKLEVKGGLVEGRFSTRRRVENAARDDAGQERAPRHAARDAPGAAPAVRHALLQAPAQNLVYLLAAKERKQQAAERSRRALAPTPTHRVRRRALSLKIRKSFDYGARRFQHG